MSEPPSLLERLKRRKIVQWGIAYLAGAWLVLQVLTLLAHPFAWPGLVLRAATVLLAVGFLAALVLAWYHGEKGAQKASGVELLMLAGILVIAGTAVAFVSGRATPGAGRADGGPGPADAGTAPSAASIAVLPFVNMSSDPEQEYFSDGLTEELLNVLAQLPELRVASRTSSFAFKGSRVSIDSVARALRVAHVLEGSVRKDGESIRITAQLIRAEDGYHIWSDTYDRELRSVFAVQDEIARAIVGALQLRLGGGRGAAPLAREETRDPEAHTLVLRAVHHMRQGGREGYAQAVPLLEQAIRRDPAYARAHAELSLARSYQAYARFGPREELVEEARQAAERALALDSLLAQAHFALAEIARLHDWEFRAAEAHFRRAIDLHPGLAHARSRRAWLLMQLGRPEEALAEARRATELDPVSPGMLGNLGAMFLYSGQLERAVEATRTSLALEPDGSIQLSNLALGYTFLGRHAEAIEAGELARARAPDQQWSLGSLAYAYARAGRRDDAELTIRALEALPEPSPYMLATVYAALGETERAFSLLERAVDEKDAAAPDLGVDPAFEAFRGDPRMRQLLDRMGLP